MRRLKRAAAIVLSAALVCTAAPTTGIAAAPEEEAPVTTAVRTSVQTAAAVTAPESLEREEITFTEYGDVANQMYDVTGRNRLEARTDSALPYQSEQAALVSARDYKKESSSYVQMLTGDAAANKWDLTVVDSVKTAAEKGLIGSDGKTNAFAATGFSPVFEEQGGIWKHDVSMPMSWTMQDMVNLDGTTKTQEERWDYAIYDNVKMPWQGSEKPYGSQPTSNYGTLEVGQAPVEYNPIGFYRTSFTLDESMKEAGNRIRISFQGVESAYYVFVNGEPVGYSEDTFRGHEFDITDYLVEGENSLAVRVHKFSDGTWLEDQDMIYDGGIYRDVYLISVPAVSIEDYKIETDFDDNFENADLIVKNLKLKNNTGEEIPAGYQVTANLYDREDLNAVITTLSFTTEEAIPTNGSLVFEDAAVQVQKPKQWSAEKPNLYILSLNLTDHTGQEVSHAAQLVGFREITFTMSTLDSDGKNNVEKYDRIKINGQPLLMKGTNRHDSDPLTGKYVSKEVFDLDVKTMKQYNINSIRTSHYSNDEYLYYLADTYGMYVMGETNAECHQVAQSQSYTDYDDYARLVEMFKDRTVTAYQTLKNHSSIITWSIGNECGRGNDTAKTVYQWMVDYFHGNDPTRFVHSEFVDCNTISVDLKSNMYPSVGNRSESNSWDSVHGWSVRPGETTNLNKKEMPYFICEYAHAMGNAVGDLDGYWNAIRYGTNTIGACVWDWVDQSRAISLNNVRIGEDGSEKTWNTNRAKVAEPWDYYAEDGAYGTQYYKNRSKGYFYGYGGDWGDVNNQNTFCVNGLVSPDRQPQPELYQVKYEYQSFWMKETPIYEQQQLAEGGQAAWTTEDTLKNGQIVLYNENNFTDLNEYILNWSLTEDGAEIAKGTIEDLPSIAPKEAGTIDIPYLQELPVEKTAGAEYQLYVELVTREASWALKQGHEIAHEQFTLPVDVEKAEPAVTGGSQLQAEEQENAISVTGNNFSLNISKQTGFLSDYVVDGETVVQELKPNYWRSTHDNDGNLNGNWKNANLPANIHLVPSMTKVTRDTDGRYVIDLGMKLDVTSVGGVADQAKQRLRYIIDESGAVTLKLQLDTSGMKGGIEDQKSTLRMFPRLGTELKMDKDYETLTWYGNGMKTGEDYEYGYRYPLTEGYSDRDTYAVKGIYSTTATDSFFPHMHLQESGTVNKVAWAKLASDSKEKALLVSGKQDMEVSALHWSTNQLHLGGSGHAYQLETPDATYFNVDYRSIGIGNSSCGPQVSEDSRLNIGEVYEYEYTMLPVASNTTAAEAAADSRAWKAVPASQVEEAEFEIDLGFLGYVTISEGLPETVSVNGTEMAVDWEKNIYQCETYEENEITGSLANGNFVAARIQVLPDKLQYFVDCNDSDATVFDSVKAKAPALLNAAADQSFDGSWGISSVQGTDYDTPGKYMTPGDKYKTGWYVKAGKTLDYKFTLPAGAYKLTAGVQEFWPGNAARYMTFTVKDASGNELGSGTADLNGRYAEDGITMQKEKDKANVLFNLEEDAVVTAQLSKTSGGDPQVSWMAITRYDAETDKEGVYLDEELQDTFDQAFTAAAGDTSRAHTIAVYSDAETAQRNEMTNSANDITIVNGFRPVTVKQTGSNMTFLNKPGKVLTLGNSEVTATNKNTALTFDANSKKRFMENNTGTVNLHHGVIIKNGKDARGGAFDVKSGTVYMYGGMLTDNQATGTSGGGAVSVMGSGSFYMYDGTVSGNTSDGSYGGGVSVMENSKFHMSGGTITDNTGYDVYVGSSSSSFYMSGNASVGEIYIAADNKIRVEGAFTTGGSHGTIIPASYADGTTVVTYAEGLTPDPSQFSVAPDGTTVYQLYAEGQDLKLRMASMENDYNGDQKITAVDALILLKKVVAADVSPEKDDINKDSTVDTKDVLALLKKASGEQN